MFPALFRIPIPDWFPEFLKPAGGYFPIRMFGVMVILGFLAGTWVASRRLAKKKIMTSEETFDFCFYLLAMGILGSRLCYVFQNWGDFQGGFFRIFKIWEGGLVWYGGAALAALFAFWWLWKNKKPVLQVTDALALGVAIGLCIGRWGCFFAGDDYGDFIRMPDPADATQLVNVTDPALAPWYGVQFPKGGPSVPPSELSDWRYVYSEVPRSHQTPYFIHPVQLYMSFKNLVIFGLLWLLARKARRPGVITAAYLMLYPVARFIVEFWRGDADRGIYKELGGLSFSQLFGLFPVLLGIMVLSHVRKTAPPPEPSA